jgi:HlyD family secretion protein
MKIMMHKPSIFQAWRQSRAVKLMVMGALLLVAGGLIYRWWLGPVVAIDVIEKRDFAQTIVASGHVESPHRIDVGTQLTGTVKKVPVSEGQMVQKDQLLLELENSEPVANLKQAVLSVVQAEAKIRQLKEVQMPVLVQAYRQAQATQSTSQNALMRAENLFAQGFIGQATYHKH